MSIARDRNDAPPGQGSDRFVARRPRVHTLYLRARRLAKGKPTGRPSRRGLGLSCRFFSAGDRETRSGTPRREVASPSAVPKGAWGLSLRGNDLRSPAEAVSPRPARRVVTYLSLLSWRVECLPYSGASCNSAGRAGLSVAPRLSRAPLDAVGFSPPPSRVALDAGPQPPPSRAGTLCRPARRRSSARASLPPWRRWPGAGPLGARLRGAQQAGAENAGRSGRVYR